MVLKYDFNITQTNNGFIDALAYGNDNSYGLLVYSIILLIMGVVAYVQIKKTNDPTLGLIRSLFVGIVMSTLFYYGGRALSISLFSGTVYVSMILILVGSVGVAYYSRNKLGG